LGVFNAAGTQSEYMGVWDVTAPNAVFTVAGNTNATGLDIDIFVTQTSSGLTLKPEEEKKRDIPSRTVEQYVREMEEWGVQDAMNVLTMDEKSWSSVDRRTVELFGAKARVELSKFNERWPNSRARLNRGRPHQPIVVEQSDDDKGFEKVTLVASKPLKSAPGK